jgi:hypothetical protein
MVQPESAPPTEGPTHKPDAPHQTPKKRRTIFYAVDLLLIFVPLGVILYFMFDPPAFDAFLNWLVKLF